MTPLTVLARIAHPVNSEEKLLAMFIAYFDESGDPSNTEVMTIAGLVARAKDWERFEGKWMRTLRRFHLSEFHMSEYENRQGEFSKLDNDQRVKLVAELAAILKNTIVFAVANSLPIQAWKDILGKEIEAKRGRGEYLMTYIMLFDSCLLTIAEEVILPPEKTIACVFDQNSVAQHFSSAYYQALLGVRGYKSVFGSITYADRRKIVPLQAADMLAYEGYKHACRWDEHSEGLPWRKLTRNLCSTGCVRMARFTRRDLDGYREKYLALMSSIKEDDGGVSLKY
jgi:uncharacterized protein DUF3800